MFLLSIIQNFAENVIESAQTSPGVYVGILAALFEVFVRLRPTEKNLSILDKIHKLLSFILPNYKRDKSLNDAGNLIKDKFKIK